MCEFFGRFSIGPSQVIIMKCIQVSFAIWMVYVKFDQELFLHFYFMMIISDLNLPLREIILENRLILAKKKLFPSKYGHVIVGLSLSFPFFFSNHILTWMNDDFVADRVIRHRACALKDTAYAIIKTELDKEFEKACVEIQESRKRRGIPACYRATNLNLSHWLRCSRFWLILILIIW